MKKNFWNRGLWPALGLGLLAVAALQARAGVSPAARRAALTQASSQRPREDAAEGRVVAYPGAQAVVGTDLAGTIVHLDVQEKEKVRKGQLLAELRSDDYRAALSEAKARIVEADADIRLAGAEVDRVRSLWETAVGSRHALDRARLKPQDPGKPEDTRVLLVKIALLEPTPLKLGQRVEIRIEEKP